jgi:LPXTG-motif cell wall-anchored protein
MLIGNALSVSILQWGVMPALTALLGRWLKTNASQNSILSIAGLCLLLLLLAALALVFRQVTG